MRIATALTLVLLSMPSSAWAQIPRTLSYQGSLTGPGGVPHPDGTYSFTFRLYESASGGAPLWTETKSLATVRGVFSTVLGDVSALGPGVAFDRPYWLGIQLGSDPEFGPRIPLTASGYSLASIKADTAAFALSAPLQAAVDSARVAGTVPDNVITSAKVANGTLVDGDIAAGAAIAGSKLVGGAITATQLGSNAVTSIKILDGTVQRSDVVATFKAPRADTSDYALNAALALPFTAAQSNVGATSLSVTNSAASGVSTGLQGQSNSPSGFGIRGIANAGTGTNVGVYGSTNSPSGYGGYFVGDGLFTGDLAVEGGLAVNGTLSHTPITRYAWVRPMDFDAGYPMSFTVNGIYGATAGNIYQPVAAVDLPHGATIIEMRAFILDNAAQDMLVQLHQLNPASAAPGDLIGEVSSSGTGAAARAFVDASIANPTVDLVNHCYAVFISFTAPSPANALQMRGIRFTYTVAGP